jgi:hypothetical protein
MRNDDDGDGGGWEKSSFYPMFAASMRRLTTMMMVKKVLPDTQWEEVNELVVVQELPASVIRHKKLSLSNKCHSSIFALSHNYGLFLLTLTVS